MVDKTAVAPHHAGMLSERLAGHTLIRTGSLEVAREEVARVFCPHRLSTVDGSGRLATVHNRVDLGDISLNFLDYGATVDIDPGELGSFFLIQMPLHGGSTVSCGRQVIESTVDLASVPDPTKPLSMRWHDQSPHLLVYVSRIVAEKRLSRLLGHELVAPLRFDLGMDMTTPLARTWRRLVDLAVADSEGDGLMLVEEARTQLVDLTLTGLLMAHRHNYSECLREGVRPAAPTMVRRALELFDEDPSRSITVTEMAAAAGCSIRSLQEGFQRYVGCSPTEYLRDVRLKRVHETLTASGTQTSVADVAHSYGFTHLGRFAQAYRQRFGELPSETLRGGL